ncbi:MAG: hypothetical protein ACR2N2_08805 [Acidimicrobiia bacterium]
MLIRIIITIAALSLFLAACSSGSSTGVASIADNTDVVPSVDETASAAVDDEDALLAFAACMRDNGVEGFEDPQINSDGTIEFSRPSGEGETIDRAALRTARDACASHLEGLAFGPGSVDRSEIEDTLVEFATCMRENGVDMPDPDFSGEPGEGTARGPFGDIDTEAPAFEEALETCQEAFGGQLRIPGGRGGRG